MSELDNNDIESLEVIESSDLKVGSAFHAFKFAAITAEETQSDSSES